MLQYARYSPITIVIFFVGKQCLVLAYPPLFLNHDRYESYPPRVNLTRFHGVFAPNSKHRIHVTPAKRGIGRKAQSGQAWKDKTPSERHIAMTWMQRLKRVFDIDIEICEKCQGPVRIIACVEDPAVIEKILKHLKERSASTNIVRLPPERAPPQIELLDRS